MWEDNNYTGYPQMPEVMGFEMEEGDSYEAVAQAFQITPETIAVLNPEINMAQVTPGQVIVVPTPRFCPGGEVYIARTGDTLASIARQFGVTVDDLLSANPFLNVIRLRPGLPICIPARRRPCPGFFYTVRPGDTLARIASRFNTTVAAILRVNPGLEPDRLFPGQRICIPQRPRPPVCPGFIYTVQLGDTLFTLARRFNTTVAAILKANPGLDPDRLFVGQRICIPVPQPPPCPGFFYTVEAGDTLFSIARRFRTTVEDILEVNPGLDPNRIFVGQRICIPVPQPRPCPGFVYTVVAGDTLFNIARRFNTTVTDILEVNPGLDPERIVPGQQICIPRG